RGPDPAFALLCADSSWERVGEVGKPHSQLPSRCFLWPRSVSPARADSSWEMRSQLPSSGSALLRRTPQIQVGNGAAHLGLPNLIFSISVKVLTAPASCGARARRLARQRLVRCRPPDHRRAAPGSCGGRSSILLGAEPRASASPCLFPPRRSAYERRRPVGGGPPTLGGGVGERRQAR